MFGGAATITFSDPAFPDQSSPVGAVAFFNAQRDAVILLRMDNIVSMPFDAGVFGANVTTVSLQRSATGNVLPGCNLTIRTLLRFDHSLDLPFYEEDSDLNIILSTLAAGGSAIDQSGHAVLVGGGTFEGGFLGGRGVSCTVTLDGTFNPIP